MVKLRQKKKKDIDKIFFYYLLMSNRNDLVQIKDNFKTTGEMGEFKGKKKHGFVFKRWFNGALEISQYKDDEVIIGSLVLHIGTRGGFKDFGSGYITQLYEKYASKHFWPEKNNEDEKIIKQLLESNNQNTKIKGKYYRPKASYAEAFEAYFTLCKNSAISGGKDLNPSEEIISFFNKHLTPKIRAGKNRNAIKKSKSNSNSNIATPTKTNKEIGMLKRNLPLPIKKSRKRSRRNSNNNRRKAIITGLRNAEKQNKKMRDLVERINNRLKSYLQGPKYESKMKQFIEGLPIKKSPTLSKRSK